MTTVVGRMLHRSLPRRLRAAEGDLLREQRVALVLGLVEQFVYDLGLLIAGHPVAMEEYVAPATVARLHGALQPLRSAASAIRVEFGEYADVRIEGDLLDQTSPIRSVVEFEDRSARIDQDGRPLAGRRRRIRLRLVLDPAVTKVLDHSVENA